VLNLANLAEEVQIVYHRRIKLKKGYLKKLVHRLKMSPEEVFDALMNQIVDLVLTPHPTQSVPRSLLHKHG
ncbi:phosphoenolpyruvate carboxylase gene, partial [Tanacetum coccineum]